MPRLRADMRMIRQAYRRAMRQTVKTPAQEWLCDNAWLLRQAAADVRADLRALPTETRRLSALFSVCTELYAAPDVWTQTSLTDALHRSPPDGAAVQALSAVLRAVIVHAAAAGVNDAQQIGKAVRSLRALAEFDMEEVLRDVCPLERTLREDPSGIYEAMDDASRAQYRLYALRAAKRKRCSPEETAEHAVERAKHGASVQEKHVGTYLLPAFPHRRGAFFLCLECLLPFVLCGIYAAWTRTVLVPMLLVLPVWSMTAYVCSRLSLAGVQPRRLPRMDFDAVPPDLSTLITVSALLPSAAKTDGMEGHLEQLYLSNGGENVRVLLLADLKHAGTPEKPEDRADIAAARRMTDRLNERHGGGFLLAIRRRTYAPTEGYWSGWERKRGAITQLVREITGAHGGFSVLHGDTEHLRDTRYLLLLDSDTQLPMGTAAELLRVAAHPLHRPVVDKEKGIVTAGYGVLAPRVCTEHTSRKTSFQRIFSGDCGMNMYDNVVSERYQDLFGEGIFAGKGLVDVQAFHAVLDNALPEGIVLSHDSVEGGFLRCGFVSDVQVSDSFPKDQTSFLSRMCRWVRGDWQNLRFIMSRGPLTALTRFKLWDNLRRSLTPAVCLASLLCGVFLPTRDAAVLTVMSLLACSAEPLLGALHAFCAHGASSVTRLYDGGEVPSALGLLLRGMAQIAVLPLQGLFCTDSIVRALVRTVRHRRTLEWTTFAESNAQSARRRNRMHCLYTAAVCAVLFISGKAVLRLVAVLFLADIPFLLLSGRDNTPPRGRLSPADAEKLVSHAAAMWEYFAENCDFRNNYLPPDNVQETPVYRVAHRTSPTNIGLYLLCVLAARDLGLIDTDELCERLQQSMGSIEQLETVRGNLLNWYDTRTLAPLQPRYLSAVDCGNFLVCLQTLREGIREYAAQSEGLRALDARIGTLLERADLTAFYNEKRRLFHIGMDAETGKPSPSYYDLLMSEARMTGYYAIARRQVPKKHWAALSRAVTRAGRYAGPVSWTGTTFEYFMPYLFLPAPEGTLGAEALHFCFRCQKKRTRGKPFGISESGFYAFDRDLNYQYKAHGVQQLGLRRGLDAETVVSPYASFLMMQLQPTAAMHNLDRLERMQMTGRWGFYEAVDFTPSRTSGRSYAVVRSYMAHHVGMSLLAADNVLHDGVFRARFMRDAGMRAARSLLEEGVPTDAAILKSRALRTPSTPRERIEPHRREIAGASALTPNARIWTNGEMSLCCTDVGVSQCTYRGVSLFRHGRDVQDDPTGPFIALQGEGEILPFAPMAGNMPDVTFRCTFCGTEMRYAAVCRDLQLRVRVRVNPETAALQYTIAARNGRRRPFDGSVLVYLEPSLTPQREAENHPAFAKLFLEDTKDEGNDLFLFRKRERDGGQGVCMAAGLRVPTAYTCTRAKAAALRTGYGLSSLTTSDVSWTDMPGNGDACLALQIPVQIPSHGSAEQTLFITAASSEQEAVQRLVMLRKTGMRKGAGSLFGDGMAEEVLTERMLPAAVFGVRSAQSRALLAQNTLPLHTLWKFGVSGENPVLFYAVTPRQDASTAVPYIRAVHRLRHAGFAFDLLLGIAEEDVYDRPLYHAIQDAVREICGAPERAAGIYTADLRAVPDEEQTFLRAISVFSAAQKAPSPEKAQLLSLQDVCPTDANEKLFAFTDGGIQIPKSVAVPYLPWSLVLSGPNFGTMVSDKALGFTWAFNAHEMKLTPWDNDIARDNRGEQLLLSVNGQIYDMLRCASAVFTPDKAQWRGSAAGVTFCVEVTVAPRAMCKHCRVTLRADTRMQVQLFYAVQPVLGADRRDGDFVHVTRHADGLLLTSPCAPVRGAAYLAVQGGADTVYTDRNRFWVPDTQLQGAPYAVVGKTVDLQDAEETVYFSLSFACREDAALRMPLLPPRHVPPKGKITVHSADASFDRMVNTWLPWQIRACRLEGRTGFYQCGGAWGFRDQMQDASAFLLTDPDTARRQILRCAAVQFPEGDVLHWWHRLPRKEDGIRGVRTRVRDDLLWLPWLTASYVRVTNDTAILEKQVPYLAGEPLTAQETERYSAFRHGTVRGTLREHCLRAIDRTLQKGTHGLALIGGGDWNDGFNRVGIGGKGESVWLSMFLCMVMRDFLPYCDAETAQRYRAETEALTRAIEDAWDGDHYLRAFMDDGTALGKGGDTECAMDSLAQSFAVFAGMPKAHAQRAVQTAVEQLVDRNKGIIKLLSPPFTGTGRQAGYIAAYPPGIRENGGQYTHAAVWLCAAVLLCGHTEEGYSLFRLLDPAYFCADLQRQKLYGGEPYALAGDIPSADRAVACTGWSLYTGAAAWLYRTTVEVILGLRVESGALTVQPHLPRALLPLTLDISVGGTQIRLHYTDNKKEELCENGNIIKKIQLDKQTHHAEIR